ncbi:MAG: hypothetical protein IJN16_07785 [Lachnospiraceae bacterium]|nr:hypothetical protein [Lachnospiraceae bacterium]
MKLLMEQCKLNGKRRLVCSAVAGVILGVCLVIGYCIEKWMAVPYTDLRLYMVLLLCVFVVGVLVYLLFALLDSRRGEAQPEKEYTTVQKLLRIGGYGSAILIGWMPSFLGVYPGWFNYDAPWQLAMYESNAISAHHPVLHTVIMGSILNVMARWNGTYNKGIALYLLLQMVVLAGCFGYIVYYMGKKRVGKPGRVLAVAWFVLFPTIVLHAMCPTKDTLFAGFFAVWFLFTYDMLRRPEWFFRNKLKMAGWVVLLFLCIVFRQNSLYVFLIMTVPVLLSLRKNSPGRYWKTFCAMLAGVAVLYGLYIGPFYALFDVKPGSKVEFLSVPSQQLVKVYLQEGNELAPEEKAKLESLFQEAAFVTYRPKIADYTKGNLRLDVMEDMGGDFWKLYGSLFMQYPDVYLDSFFTNTYGFWYPDATVDIYEDGVSYYFASEHVPPAVENSKIPLLLKYYKSFYTDFPVEDAGPLTWGLSMALYFYLLLITLIYMIYQRKTAAILCCMTVFLLWLTYLLGPAALVRYVLFLYVLPPVECLLLRGDKLQK